MTVVKVFTPQTGLVDLTNNPSINNLITMGVLANNASLNINEANEITLVGDPTESSILEAGHKLNINKTKLDTAFRRVFELPFDSDRKLMSVIVEYKDKFLLITKGAIDALSSRLVTSLKENALTANEQMGNQALRVLGLLINDLTTNQLKLIHQHLNNN